MYREVLYIFVLVFPFYDVQALMFRNQIVSNRSVGLVVTLSHLFALALYLNFLFSSYNSHISVIF